MSRESLPFTTKCLGYNFSVNIRILRKLLDLYYYWNIGRFRRHEPVEFFKINMLKPVIKPTCKSGQSQDGELTIPGLYTFIDIYKKSTK